MPTASLIVDFEVPAKPPTRTFEATISLENNSPDLVYFVVPFFMDQPLLEEIHDLRAIEIFKTKQSDLLYVGVHRNPACYIFPTKPNSELHISKWRIATWREVSTFEIWAAQEVSINNSKSLQEWITDAHIANVATTSEDHQLMMSWEPESPATLSIKGISARFPMSPDLRRVKKE